MQRAARIERPLGPHVPHVRVHGHVLEDRFSTTVVAAAAAAAAVGEKSDGESVGPGRVDSACQCEAVVDEDFEEGAVDEDVEV